MKPASNGEKGGGIRRFDLQKIVVSGGEEATEQFVNDKTAEDLHPHD